MVIIYLYNSTVTDFTYNGQPLNKAYEVVVDNMINDSFFVAFNHPLDDKGIYKNIEKDKIVKVHTPDGMQPFRIMDRVKYMDHISIEAWPLFYADMRNKLVKPLTIRGVSGQAAVNTFVNNLLIDTPFTFTSNVTDAHDYHTQDTEERENNPNQLYNALDVFKDIVTRWQGELVINGYDIRMLDRLGKNTGALLFEKKNISDFTDEESIQDVTTRLYGKSEWTERPEGSNQEIKHKISVKVESPLINAYSGIVFEKQYTNNDIHTEKEMTDWLNLKFTTDNIDKPSRNIKVGTNIVDDTVISLGDSLVLKYVKHDVDMEIRMVGYTYDGYADRYITVQLGDAKESYVGNVQNTVRELETNVNASVKQTVNQILNANGERLIYSDIEPVGNFRNGDVWYDQQGGMYFWDEDKGMWIDHPYNRNMHVMAEEVGKAVSSAEEAKSLAVSEAESALAQAKSDATAKANAIKEEVGASINTAIETSETAKQTAIDGYNNAVAEAERLAGEQTTAFDTRFGNIEDSVDTFNQSVADIDAKADDALKKAGANADALITHQNVLDTINTVTLPDISSTAGNALANAKDAMDEAKEADNKIANYVTTNGLVSGTTVDRKIDDATGAISRKITSVEGKIDGLQVGGRNLILDSGKEVFVSSLSTGYNDSSLTIPLVDGETYTLSFDAKSSEALSFTKGLFINNGTNDVEIKPKMTIDENYSRYTSTFVFKDIPYNNNSLYLHLYPNQNGKLYIKNIKLEKGSIPTDWSPAPEDNLSQSEFQIFESTYDEDVKGINSTLTDLSSKKLDGTTYTDFYNNEYKKTAKGVTDAWTAVNKIIDEDGSTTDTFAKAVYDRNAERQKESFQLVTNSLVTEATYEAGVKGINQSITTIRGDLENLKIGGENLLVRNTLQGGYVSVLGKFALDGSRKNTTTDWIEIGDAKELTFTTYDKFEGDFKGRVALYSDKGESNFISLPVGYTSASPIQSYTFDVPENAKYARATLIYGDTLRYKLEKGNVSTDWSPAPEDMLGKADFQVFKGTYENNDQVIKNRLTAIDSGKEGSVIYNTNEALSTAQGNTKEITSVKGKINDLSSARNLLKESWHNSEDSPRVFGGEYLIKSWELTEPLKLNQKYTFRIFGLTNRTGFDLHTPNAIKSLTGNLGGNTSENVIRTTDSYLTKGRMVWEKTFIVTQDVLNNMTANRVNLYHKEETQNGAGEIYWATLVEGTAGIDWSPSLTDQLGKAEFTLFKNDYDETAESVERRLTAIDSSEDGSFLTRLNATESTASGNSGLIATVKSTADGAVQSNSLEYQRLTETSEIHQRVIGSEGVLTYSKNRRLGAKSQEIPQGHTAKIEHNGGGFEVGKTYTLSFDASCLSEDVIKWLERSRTETIPFKRVVKEDNTIFEKDSYIERNGVNGNVTYTWTVETVNGVETGNRTDEAITGRLDPIDEIYVKGTKTSSVVNFTIKKSLQDLSDAKVVMLGDSITMGYGRTAKIPDVVKNELNAQSVQNAGYGSTTAALHPNKPELRKIGFTKLVDSIVSGSWSEALNVDLTGISYATPQTYKQSLINLSNTNFNNVDAVIIMYGTNDWAMDVKLDNSSNRYDQSTYLGALRYGINKLQQAYPHLEILVAQPILWTMGSITSEGYNNGIGLKVRDYANGLNNSLGVSIPVAQTYNKGITTSNYTNYFNTGDSNDGTHPNSAGNAVIGNLIANEFERLIVISPAPQTTSTVNFEINKGG